MPGVSIKELGQGLLHLFYPSLCEGCAKPLVGDEHVLCMGCELQLPDTGYHHLPDNDTALRFAGRVPFVHATSLAWFTNDGLVQHLVHGLKYGRKQQNGIFLGRKLGERLRDAGWANTLDGIVPVPLHPAKQAKRGYNQSVLIAEGISSVMNIPVLDGALIRTRKTESQTNKTRSERISNMADAFVIKERSALAGKHILLCDDVLTTGATLEACAHALLKEESIKISIATVGIAVS